MVSTEGSRLLTGDLACRISIEAQTKADDGMELPLYMTYFARSLAGLPSEAKLLDDARAMVALLARLRTAPVVDPYTGPAILSGRAAGVFFHEIFGHRIEGSRQKAADDAQTFSKKVGEPVLPPFLSVVADPTLQKLGDTELAGTYQFDDEGVRAQRVSVVDHGTLHEFLLSRSPLAKFPQLERPRPGTARPSPGLAPVQPAGGVVGRRPVPAAGGAAEGRGPEGRQAVRPPVRPGRGWLHLHGALHAQCVQRHPGRRLPRVYGQPADGAGPRRRHHRDAALGFQPDRRDRQSSADLQRHLRRGERSGTGVGLVARAAGLRGRSAEDGEVRGLAPDPAGAGGEGRQPVGFARAPRARRRALAVGIGAEAEERAGALLRRLLGHRHGRERLPRDPRRDREPPCGAGAPVSGRRAGGQLRVRQLALHGQRACRRHGVVRHAADSTTTRAPCAARRG